MERPTATQNPPGTSGTPSADAIEQRLVAFAEQLGRLAGTVQARADGWMDGPALQEQVTRIRDGAASLLRQLGAAAARGKAAASSGTRSPKKPATTTLCRSGGENGGPREKKPETAPPPPRKNPPPEIFNGKPPAPKR